MAKVDGPLFSVEARGKVADSIVFFPWKGRHVVRQWLAPTQPHSTKQGYIRAAANAVGRAVSKIWSKSQGQAVDSVLYQHLTNTVPAGLNWNAWYCQGFLKRLQSAGTLITASFTALVVQYSSLATAVLTAFKTNATALGLSDFAFSYGYTSNIEAGCQLYFGAVAQYYNSIAGSAPYNTYPSTWAATDVDNFKSAHTT